MCPICESCMRAHTRDLDSSKHVLASLLRPALRLRSTSLSRSPGVSLIPGRTLSLALLAFTRQAMGCARQAVRYCALPFGSSVPFKSASMSVIDSRLLFSSKASPFWGWILNKQCLSTNMYSCKELSGGHATHPTPALALRSATR